MALIAELKRRNVIRMAGLYLVGAWLLVQVSGTLLPMFGAPDWAARSLVVVLAIGFLPALAFAWIFELTPDGIKRDAEVPPEQSIAPQTARRMEHVTVVVLVLALGLFAFDKFVLAPKREAAHDAAVASAGAVASTPPAATSPGTAAASTKSIAVLPFENLSEDKANAYFADGIQDQILTGLAKIGDLKVISRTSTLSYASKPGNLREIAQTLGVANILEGSVQKAGNRVRINVQLIAAATDTHLWAETYDRDLDDIFAVQSEVAQKIAEAMAATISRNELEALQRKPTDNPAAYRAFLKARSFNVLISTDRKTVDARLDAYREAVRLDPGFALAWAELAWEENRAIWVGIDDTGKMQAEANAALARARELAPDLPQVEIARAVNLYYEKRDFTGALAVLEAVKSRLPGDQDLWMFTGFVARRVGHWDESAAAFERARELAPNDAALTYHLGVTRAAQGDCVAANQALDASLALERDPSAVYMKLLCAWNSDDLAQADAIAARFDDGKPATKALLGFQALYRHDYAKASSLLAGAIASGSDLQTDGHFNGYIPARVDWQMKRALAEERLGHADVAKALYRSMADEARKALAGSPRNPNVQAAWHAALGLALASTGEAEAARAQGQLAIEAVPESLDKLEGPVWQGMVAEIYARSGDAARALPVLRRQLVTPGAYVSRGILRIDPAWDPIRKDPGFQALLR